jgi:hypothetical protein
MTNEDVIVGQVWERHDGSRFRIESRNREYIYYWLATGSKPQYRGIRIDLLLRNYNLLFDPYAINNRL